LGWTIGEFAGPLIGGTMMEYLPFERVSSIFGIVMFTMFAIYFSYCVYLHRKANKVNSSDALITDKE
jgi:ABC-type antimicrobial peptide transport system permease subunit